jgi:serine/threonine protein kinase/WD40 repeat protein
LCPVCAWEALSHPEDAEPETPSDGNGFPLRLEGHEVQGEIARGGMGIVYRAQQFEPRRSVALKMLLPRQMGSAEMAARFRLEVRALTELEHPAILPVYHVGEHQGLPFFTMKLAAGGTLAERRQNYFGNWRGIAELMAELAQAVQFAHEHGVLHRDLKPGNILFDDRDRPYVSDFGLAKLADTEVALTRSVDFLGTPLYVAPEIATRSARHATTASDIYSLGAILYELLTGRPPFEADGVPGLLQKIAEEDPVKPSRAVAQLQKITPQRTGDSAPLAAASAHETAPSLASPLPQDLEVICLKCLAKEPARRYASAGDLARDLQAWLAGRPISARPVSGPERAWKWLRRNPLLSTVSLTLVLCLVGSGWALWRSAQQSRLAQHQAEANLAEALLAHAQALGAAHGAGQRWQALDSLAQAARIQSSLQLRSEAAAALARADLREEERFPALFGPAGSSIVFSSGLDRYAASEPDGGFAWRATQDQKILGRFAGPTRKLARWFVLAPNDQLIAAVFDDYSLEVWRFDADRPVLRWQGTVEQPPVIAFHPDSVTVAGFVPGQGLFLQRLDGTERHLLELTNGRTIFLRFNPAGTRLAAVCEPGRIEVWECQGAPHLLWSQPLYKSVPWLAWRPDGGQLLASADDGGGIRMLAALNGSVERTYSRHLLYPRQFEFDPTGRTIASISDDWSLHLWDAGSGQDLVTGVGRHRVLRFSADGRRLTTAPTDTELAVLELAPQQVFREFTGTTPGSDITSSGLVRSPDGRLLAITRPQLHIYDTRTAAELAVLEPPPGALGGSFAFFETNSSALFYSCYNDAIYRRTLPALGDDPRANFVCGPESLLAHHSEGLIRGAVQSGRTWVCQTRHGVDLWQERDPTHVRHVPTSAGLYDVAVSPDAAWAAAVQNTANRIEVRDCARGRVITDLDVPQPERVWFSPDSKWLVASLPGGYRTWSTSTWRPGASWTARLDTGDPGEISFADDSRLVAARLERATFQLLSFPDGRELVTLKPPLVLPIRNACLRGDGQRLWLLSSSFRVFEWDLAQLRAELAKLRLDWEQL